jgi:hypothetical protein
MSKILNRLRSNSWTILYSEGIAESSMLSGVMKRLCIVDGVRLSWKPLLSDEINLVLRPKRLAIENRRTFRMHKSRLCKLKNLGHYTVRLMSC